MNSLEKAIENLGKVMSEVEKNKNEWGGPYALQAADKLLQAALELKSASIETLVENEIIMETLGRQDTSE